MRQLHGLVHRAKRAEPRPGSRAVECVAKREGVVQVPYRRDERSVLRRSILIAKVTDELLAPSLFAHGAARCGGVFGQGSRPVRARREEEAWDAEGQKGPQKPREALLRCTTPRTPGSHTRPRCSEEEIAHDGFRPRQEEVSDTPVRPDGQVVGHSKADVGVSGRRRREGEVRRRVVVFAVRRLLTPDGHGRGGLVRPRDGELVGNLRTQRPQHTRELERRGGIVDGHARHPPVNHVYFLVVVVESRRSCTGGRRVEQAMMKPQGENNRARGASRVFPGCFPGTLWSSPPPSGVQEHIFREHAARQA